MGNQTVSLSLNARRKELMSIKIGEHRYISGDIVLEGSALLRIVQVSPFELMGKIPHDTIILDDDVMGEDLLRVHVAALIFHSTYGGDAGYYAGECGHEGPAKEGWIERLQGDLSSIYVASYDGATDYEQHKLALRGLRWVLSGVDLK
jgi:hypothetical protein